MVSRAIGFLILFFFAKNLYKAGFASSIVFVQSVVDAPKYIGGVTLLERLFESEDRPHISWLYRQCHEGKFPHVRQGGKFMFVESDARRHLERKTIKPR